MRRRGSMDAATAGRRAHTSLGIAGEDYGEDPAAEPIFAPALSSLPEIKHYSRQNDRSALSKKVKQGLLDPTQYYIYAESYGGVEFWRKMAKKAESAMQTEQKQYYSDIERNHELIHRLRSRISALEVLADERELTLGSQRRKIRLLRHQLQYNSKAYEREMGCLRAQADHAEKIFSMATEESKRKMLDLKHELARKDSALEMLQNDMSEIMRSIEEPLETFYLPDYFGQKTGKSDHEILPSKAANQILSAADARANPVKKTEGIKTAAKILRVRIGHDDLMKEIKLKGAENDSLLEELKTLRKGADEAFKSRDLALNSLKSFEGVVQKLEGLDRIVSQSTLLRGTDITALGDDKPHDKVASVLSKLQAEFQMLVSKADVMSKTFTLLQREKERVGPLVAQMREDLGLPKTEQNEDLAALLSAVKEQLRRRTESLQSLQKERASVEDMVTKNASRTSELERSIDELKQKHRILKNDRDNVAVVVSQVQKDKAGLQNQLLTLQSLITTLGASVQAGNYDAIMQAIEKNSGSTVNKTSAFDGQREVESIVAKLKSMVTEKSQLQETIKKTNDLLSGLIELLEKPKGSAPGKKVDALTELPPIVSKVLQLKKDNEALTSKLKAAESELADIDRKNAGQLESTMQRITEACGTLRASMQKLLPIFGDGLEASNGAATATEIAKIAADLSNLVPKVLDLKKDRDSIVSKLADVEDKRVEDRGLYETTQKQLGMIRQNLKAVQSLCPAELGKNYSGSEAEDLACIEKIKQELLASRDTKEKVMGRAQSLSLQVSLLDPILTEICATIKGIEQEIGATSVPSKGVGPSQETSGKLAFVRDRLTELKGLINTKMNRTSEEIENYKDKVKLQDGVMKNSEKKWNERAELLKRELLRLGGYDMENRQEKAKRIEAAGKVKEFISKAKKSNDATINPLIKLASFQVELLVNNKVHHELEVGGSMGGLFQAAIHYFKVDNESGEITFENATVPGSQSSNMLVELVLNPTGNNEAYESKPGDVLGLSIKVKAINDQNPREILYNSNVIHTDEVMDAIKGQALDNFSLWPDLVSSWKWEHSPSKGWILVCIKWRFLLKSIFPELSEPLQTLAIANRPVYERSQTIRLLA